MGKPISEKTRLEMNAGRINLAKNYATMTAEREQKKIQQRLPKDLKVSCWFEGDPAKDLWAFRVRIYQYPGEAPKEILNHTDDYRTFPSEHLRCMLELLYE